MGSAYASAVYISTVMKLPKDKKVYVVGMSGIEDELREEGISFLGGTVRHPLLQCVRVISLTSHHRTQRTTRSPHSTWSTGLPTQQSARSCAGWTRR